MSALPTWLPRLEGFLRERNTPDVRIVSARALTGGASRDTWAIDTESSEGPMSLVLRRDLGGEILADALDRAGEFLVLTRAYEAGVLVPRPRWLCIDPEVCSSDFFLMDRLNGESIGRRIVREPDLAAARALLPEQMGKQLAKIHAMASTGLGFLPEPAEGQSPGQRALQQARGQLDDLAEPHPVLEYALRWLSERVPECRKQVIVHGDFRVGNLMVNTRGLVGVFDWEFAHRGDPHEDLAWPCVRSWRFGSDHLRLGGVGQPESFYAAYRSAGGGEVNLDAIRFWEILGNLRWAIGCGIQAKRHLSGMARSVELASLGRRSCEMEYELLSLITGEPS